MSQILRLRDKDLEWREIQGEVVALDLKSSDYLAVNQSGAKLWAALAVGATRDQLVDVLIGGFAIPREQAEREADAFVRMLARQDILVED